MSTLQDLEMIGICVLLAFGVVFLLWRAYGKKTTKLDCRFLKKAVYHVYPFIGLECYGHGKAVFYTIYFFYHGKEFETDGVCEYDHLTPGFIIDKVTSELNK